MVFHLQIACSTWHLPSTTSKLLLGAVLTEGNFHCPSWAGSQPILKFSPIPSPFQAAGCPFGVALVEHCAWRFRASDATSPHRTNGNFSPWYFAQARESVPWFAAEHVLVGLTWYWKKFVFVFSWVLAFRVAAKHLMLCVYWRRCRLLQCDRHKKMKEMGAKPGMRFIT